MGEYSGKRCATGAFDHNIVEVIPRACVFNGWHTRVSKERATPGTFEQWPGVFGGRNIDDARNIQDGVER